MKYNEYFLVMFPPKKVEAKPIKTLAVISKEGKYLVGKKRLAKSGTKKNTYDKVLAFDIVPVVQNVIPAAQNVNPVPQNNIQVNNFVGAPL